MIRIEIEVSTQLEADTIAELVEAEFGEAAQVLIIPLEDDQD